MKMSLPRRVRRLLSAVLAAAMLASSVFSGVSVAAAGGAPPAGDSTAGPPGMSASMSPTVAAEIEASRTADSSTFQLTDGSRRAEIYSQPVHYQDASGQWADIDPTLVPTGEFGQERAKATALTETFGSDESTGSPVTVSDGRWFLGMELVGGVQDQPFALGDRAVYPLAQTDTQLTYESLRNGVKDTLVLSSPDAPDTFTFFVSLKRLALYTEPGSGAFALYDTATGKPAGRIEPLSVFDSADKTEVATAAVCAEASMTVGSAPGGAYLTYHVPRSWLDDPKRVFPVYVDPAVTFAGTDDTRADTFVAKGDSSTHALDNHLDASLFGTGDLRRALVNFRLSSLTRGTTVNSALLQMYLWQNTSGGNFTTMCQPVIGSWGANATWANTFGNGSVGIGSGGAYDTIPGGPNHYAIWNMSDPVQKWVSGTLANNGFVLYANSETAACQHSFWSAEYTAYTSRQPHLVVDYTLPTLSANPIAPLMRPGKIVKLTLHADSQVVTNMLAKVDGRMPDGKSVTTAQFAFTTQPPGDGWVSMPVAGGYVSYAKTAFVSGSRAGAIVPMLSASSTTQRDDGRDVTFVYRIGDGLGDVQNNRLYITDPDWQTTWQDTGQSYQILTIPGLIPSATTTSSAKWFEEAAGRDDSATAGRGSVALTWKADGAANGYGVYLFDGNAYEQVATTTATSWSTAGQRVYPSDSAIASMAAGFAGNPFSAGSLDLRDDPRALYAKTPGSAFDAIPAYAFKVVPYNSAGAAEISECPTLTVSLAGRTKHLADDPRHTLVDMGTLGTDDGWVRLDRGDLTLRTTDLSILGLGPDVAISRSYRSSSTAVTLSSPGWRYSFERSIVASAGVAAVSDEQGDVRTFRKVGDEWIAPHGDTDRLSGDSSTGFALSHKDRSTTSFDAAGRLCAEADAFGNTVRYEWAADGNTLVIRTPKDVPLLHERRITLALSGGKVIRATAHVSDGDADRVVLYDAQPSKLTVTTLPSTDSERTTVYRYDAAGRICSVTVPGFTPSSGGQAVWSIAYAPNCSAVTVANDTGGDTPRAPKTVSRDVSAGTGTVASASGTSTLVFDALGEQVSSTEENTSAATTDSFDVEGNLIAETSPSGRAHSAVSDGRGNVIVQTDEVGSVTTFQYSGDLCTSETDARGAVTSRAFDPTTAALRTEEKTLNEGGDRSHIEYGRNSDGSLAWERKALSATLTAETDYADYADSGQAQTMTQRGVETAPGATTDLVAHTYYDGFGNPRSTVDALGVKASDNRYDAAGRLTEVTDAGGTISHSRYGLLGDEVKSWRSNPATSGVADWVDHVVNAAGEPVADVVKASDGSTVSVTTHTYDAAGRAIKSDNSAVPGAAITRYDAQGNVTQVWDEGSDAGATASSMRTAFTADGEEASSTAPGATSASTMTSYTADGQVAHQSEPDGVTVDYAYDDADGVATQTVQTDAGAAQTAWVDDLARRPVDEVDAEGTTETTRYDLDGNEIASGLGGQAESTTHVNNLGWPILSCDSDGVVTRDVYDADGRPTAETIGTLTTTKEYDACGRLTRQVNPDGTAAVHAYDCFGFETAVTETSGTCMLRRSATIFDTAGRIAAQTVTALDGQLSTTRLHTYGADGRETVTESRRGGDVTLATVSDGTGRALSLSGIVGGQAVNWSVSATDSAGRTTGLASSTLPVPSKVGWSQAGQPQSARLGSATAEYSYSALSGKKKGDAYHFNFDGRSEVWDYAYDQQGRLTSATVNGGTTSYQYDPATGSLTSKKTGDAPATMLAYDSSGHLLAAGSRVFRSDALGRRVGSGTAASPTESAYAWTGDRLTGFSAGGVSASYVYDAAGQRLRSVVSSGGLTTSTQFDYDGTRLLGLSAQRSDGASWTVDYVYDDDGILLGGTYLSGNQATSFAAETMARGDVRELLDSSGVAFAFYGYDAYGTPSAVLTTGTAGGVTAKVAAEIASRQPLRFGSYAFDAESGLYYCSARYYDPTVAAFISKDPDSSDGEQSAHQYCSDNPVGNVDPTGCDVWGYGNYDGGLYWGTKLGELVLVNYCRSRVGGKYVYGAKAKPGKEWKKGPLDCSGLTAAAYRVAHRVARKTFPIIPDGSANQHDASKSLGFNLKASKLKISDLGFLHKGGTDSGAVHHVGIYVGRGWVVEARGRKWGVVKTSLRAFNKRGADWHRARKD